MYAQPPQPSFAAAKAFADLGDGMQRSALLERKLQADKESEDRKYARDLELARERARLEWDNKRKELEQKAVDADKRVAEYKDYLGVGEKPKEEQFTQDYSYADELGQTQKVVDKEKFGKARDEWGRKGILATTMAVKPEASDDVEKAFRTNYITGKMRDDGTPEGIRQLSIAEGGKARRTQGKSGVLDDWTGEVTPTDLTKAEAEDERASARHHEASAGKQRADADNAKKGGAKTNDPRYKALEAQYNRAEQEVSRITGLIKDYEIAAANPVNTDTLAPKITQARASLEAAISRRNDLARRLDDWTQDSPGAPTPKDGAKLDKLPPGAKQVGTHKGKKVYELPDGRRFVEE